MKTEKEIREEIERSKRAIENNRNIYRDGKITRQLLKETMLDNEATIDALKWVLGENDRYD